MTLDEKLNDLVDAVSDWDAIVEDYTYEEGDKTEHIYNKVFLVASKHLQNYFGGPIELEIAINATLEKIFVGYSCSLNGSFLSDIEKNIVMEIHHKFSNEIKTFDPDK